MDIADRRVCSDDHDNAPAAIDVTAGRAYALGIDLGTTYTCAAVAGGGGPPRVVQLSGTSQTIPSVVSIADGSVLAGEAAERRLVSHPADTAREFKRRFGDPAPIVLAGRTYGAEVLTGHLVAEVIERVTRAEGESPTTVAIAHPASWGPFRLDLLRDAARQAGIDDLVLVPEPVAAAVANRDRVDQGSLVAVYDLGGGTFDAAVVRADGDWEVVGTPEGVERLGGIDFDQAILSHVDATLDGQVFSLDSADADARSALMQLRAECQAAKEHLSQDTDVDISVSLPTLRTSVRLTRSEFESMVRPRLADSLAVFDRVVSSAASSWDDVSAVLLVGGSSNIPVVNQLVAEHTGRPVTTATNPHLAIALGTAAIAAEHGSATAAPSGVAPAPVAAAVGPDSGESAGDDAPSGRPRRTGVIVAGAVAALAAVVAGVVVLSGGDDGDTAATAGAGTAVSAAEPDPSGSTAASTSGSTLDAAEPSESTTGSPVAAVAVDVVDCGTAGPTISAVLEQSGGVVAIGDDGRSEVPGATIVPCSIDLSERQPGTVNRLEAPAVAAASAGDVLAVSSSAGGLVFNGATGTVVECPLLTGPLAVIPSGATFVIVDGVVLQVRPNRNGGCVERDNSAFDGIVASAVGAVSESGSDRVAVGGTVDGSPELWVFPAFDERVIVGGTQVPGGFGSIDAVVACDGAWCVIDLSRQLVHVVDLDGTSASAVEVAGTSLDGVAAVLASGPTDAGPGLLTLEAADGSRSIVSLSRS